MVATSIILLSISILLLRNQIKPIELLAQAAESFGKGHSLGSNMKPTFHLRGAREVRRAGLAFFEMRQRIERALAQRTSMLAGVSHDLRTVLTRFRLQLALVPPSKETKALESDITDMQNMLEAYLDFAKDDTNESASMVNILDILNRFAPQAKEQNCSWSVVCKGDHIVMARPLSILRLFTNIISNSLSFSSAIEISLTRGDKWLAIDFHDNGPGIAPDMRDEVFKPFVRLDASRNLNSSGSGLGLSIARDIVHGHGGTIKLDDSHLGGLQVRVRIPS